MLNTKSENSVCCQAKMKAFDKFIKDNKELINSITPLNPTISKDDEWNDPIYDDYDIKNG